MMAEAKLLRQHKGRLEARMQILEDHNRQLEAQLQRLRQLLDEVCIVDFVNSKLQFKFTFLAIHYETVNLTNTFCDGLPTEHRVPCKTPTKWPL